jgi:hypothetical protein
VPADGSRGLRLSKAHALLVTLVYSRHQYVHVSFSQTVKDLIAGLEDAWEFFGGVTARVVLDNLKAAVTKADRYDPVFSRTFAEYAQWRGFVIDAALPRHATGNPHVERNVQYLRESFFVGEAVRWCRETAGQRVHGTTRRQPLAVFEDEEKPKLRPLEQPRFDPPGWSACKVHGDHHVQFRKSLYSVPTRHVGKTVWVRGDAKLVRIYVGGECVKTHEVVAEGCRSTDYADYPAELAPYAMRDPEAIVREARRQGEHVGRWVEKLLAGPFPWARLRQAQKLLRLANKYGRPRVEAACRVGYEVLCLRTDRMLQTLHQARADHTTEKAIRRLLAPDVLILDDFACAVSTAGSRATSTRSSSNATGARRPSSRATAPSTSGSRSSTIPSSPRAPSTAWPTTPIRS